MRCSGVEDLWFYENTLGSSLTSATNSLCELEPVSTSVNQNINAFHIYLTWFLRVQSNRQEGSVKSKNITQRTAEIIIT